MGAEGEYHSKGIDVNFKEITEKNPEKEKQEKNPEKEKENARELQKAKWMRPEKENPHVTSSLKHLKKNQQRIKKGY